MSEGFEGCKVIVVGGSSGIGFATARQVIAGGSAVVTGRDPDKLRTAVETLSRDGKAWGIEADLADRAQVSEVRNR